MNRRHLAILRKAAALFPVLILSLSPLLSFPQGRTQTSPDPGLAGALKEAKAELQKGVNTWDLKTLESARNSFLGLLVKSRVSDGYLLYYAALSDYRLASYHLSADNKAEAERYALEGQQYASKAAEALPSFGEAHALYAYLLALELAVHPEQAMTLGMQSMTWFAKAMEIGSENPRVNLLKGIYQLYVPASFGGGPESALEFLARSAALFEKEHVQDPLLPSWGKEEAYAYLGRVYRMTKDYARARSSLTKALAINPDCGLAKSELQALDKDEKDR